MRAAPFIAAVFLATALLPSGGSGAHAATGSGGATRSVTGVAGEPKLGAGSRLASPAAGHPAAVGPQGTAVLGDGRLVTPAGRTVTVDQDPLNLVVSRDGRRLYTSSDGYDDSPTGNASGNNGDTTYHHFINVVDAATLQRTRVADNDLFYGLAESPDGRHLYTADAGTSSIGVFDVTPTGLSRTGRIALGSNDIPWSIAVTPDGIHLLAAAFGTDRLDIVDLRTGTMIARVSTGNYPYGVVVSRDGRHAFVSNWGTYNTYAHYAANPTGQVPPVALSPTTPGGYNGPDASSVWAYDITDPTAPTVTAMTRIGTPVDGAAVQSGSLPGAMALSPDGRTLAVAAGNDDIVALLDAASGKVRTTVDLRVYEGGPYGDQPDGVAWAPDGATLYVAEGGRNSVAVVDVATAAVRGRIPTGWYPSGVQVSPDGAHLYVSNAKGLGTGPNTTDGARLFIGSGGNGMDPHYVGNLLLGTVQDVPLAVACSAASLASLTRTVAADDGLVPDTAAADPSGGVLPTTYGSGGSKVIKHVVLIVKENRTYDQVLGDLAGTERAQRWNIFGGAVTPNTHAIATQFATSDNYYTTAQSSNDGHFIASTGTENEFDQKTTASQQFGPANLIVNTSAENLPVPGFLWQHLAQSGLTSAVFGEGDYPIGLGPSTNSGVAPGTALYRFDPAYPTQINEAVVPGNRPFDEQRAAEFTAQVPSLTTGAAAPAFTYMILFDDHTFGAPAGGPAPETMVAINDHALGEVVSALSSAATWDQTAVFVTEDDTQGGQDHVDAQRTLLLAAGGHIRPGYVSHTHTSSASLTKTIDLLLGAPPTSLQEYEATPLSDLFDPVAHDAPYTTRPQQVGNTPLPAATAASNPAEARAQAISAAMPRRVDGAGDLLPTTLLLDHLGRAAEPGNPGVVPTPDITEHTLLAAVPPPLAPPATGAPCGPSAGTTPVAGTSPNTSPLATPGTPVIEITALAILSAALSGRRRRSRHRARSVGG